MWFVLRPGESILEAFLVSTGIVALGEMGDKTQLLALLLAATFRRPVPIVLGILVATLVNHALAGAVGDWIARALGPDVLRWVIGVLVPGHGGLDADPRQDRRGRGRHASASACSAPRWSPSSSPRWATRRRSPPSRWPRATRDLVAVVAGTTLGMMIANVPAVLLGDVVAKKVSMPLVHGIAALIFAVLGVLTLLNVGQLF